MPNKALLIMLLVLTLGLTGCSLALWQPPQPEPIGPTAVLEFAYLGEVEAAGVVVKAETYPPGEFAFSSLHSQPGDTPIESYTWRFGEAQIEGALVRHTFSEAGVYPVTLTVKDANGLTDTATVVLFIEHKPVTPPPDEPDEPTAKTDRKENSYFIFERTFITPVALSEPVTITVTVTAKVPIEFMGCKEQAPDFTVASGNLIFFDTGLAADGTMTRSYTLTAPEEAGDYLISGKCKAVLADGNTELELRSVITVIEGGDNDV